MLQNRTLTQNVDNYKNNIMTEKEKELKSFNQCADALSMLDKKGILKVFHMLSIHFEVVPFLENSNEHKTNVNNEENIINEIYIEETPKIIKKSSKNSNISGKKTKASNTVDLVYLTEYDFRPPGGESLKDFHSQYKSTSNMENNLIFIYYLQEIRNQKEITMSHVFSCYRHLGIKLPSFPSTLNDTKRLKGWIDNNPHDLKSTREGINYMEHEITKAND